MVFGSLELVICKIEPTGNGQSPSLKNVVFAHDFILATRFEIPPLSNASKEVMVRPYSKRAFTCALVTTVMSDTATYPDRSMKPARASNL